MRKQNVIISLGIVYSDNETDDFVAKNISRNFFYYKPPANNGEKVRFACRLLNFDDSKQAAAFGPANYPDWLIVVCSPQLMASERNIGFINGFIALKGLDKVALCVSQGEPGQVFPECLRWRETITLLPDGSRIVSREEVEPLAADFRAENNIVRHRLIKNDYLKIAALILAVRYDDLKQRRKINKRIRRKRALQIFAGAYGLALVILTIVTCRYNTAAEKNKDTGSDYANMQLQKAYICVKSEKYDEAWDSIKEVLQLVDEYELSSGEAHVINLDALYECGFWLFPYEVDWSASDEAVIDIPENGSGYTVELTTADENPYLIKYYCGKATDKGDGWKVAEVLKIQKDEYFTSKYFFVYPNGNYVLATPQVRLGNSGDSEKLYFEAGERFSIEDGSAPIDTYLGTDNDGVSYFKGGNVGYILGPNGTLLTTLDYLYRVDYENEKLILKKDNKYLTMDILTYERICENLEALVSDSGADD